VPEDERNTAERNPPAYASDMPMFSTDVRMEKAAEVIRSALDAPRDRSVEVSDGGGPVEAVWWVKGNGVATQWRVRGDAWVLGEDIGGEGDGPVRVRKALMERMRVVREDGVGDWKWKREIGVVFGAQSQGIKGSLQHLHVLIQFSRF
jgi:pyridoxamine 5'-phosphate oxidase